MSPGAAFSAINTPTALHETEESPAKRNHLKRGACKEGPIVEPWFGLGWFELATDWLLLVLPIITAVILIFSGTTMLVMLVSQYINILVIVDTTAALALYIVGQYSCSLCSSLKYTDS